MPTPTTDIKTESARPALTQTLEDLYENMHTGGTFDTKAELVTDGSRNEQVTSVASRTNTPKGFKTKMQERLTELFMGQNSETVTTTMRTSIFGDHSNEKYGKRFGHP